MTRQAVASNKSIDCAANSTRIALHEFVLESLTFEMAGRGVSAAALLLAAARRPPTTPPSDNPQSPVALTGTGTGVSPTDTTSGDLTAARFHVGDTVTVSLLGTADPIPDHPTHQGRRYDYPPLHRRGQAAGLTAGELQNAIHGLYVPQYYVRLTITVSSPERVFYVGGEVKQPGRQLYIGETTVTKAIQSAGDFTDFANRSKVWLTRSNGERIKVNCTKALQIHRWIRPFIPGTKFKCHAAFSDD